MNIAVKVYGSGVSRVRFDSSLPTNKQSNMSGVILHNLSNGEYHHGYQYSKYISSTQLKYLLISPAYFKYQRSLYQYSTEAMIEGSVFHSFMECYAKDGNFDKVCENVLAFTTPINPRTGQEYGPNTKAVQEALQDFKDLNPNKFIIPQQMYNNVRAMVESIMTSERHGEVIKKLLKWGTPEVSMFLEEDEYPAMKIRCDLLTKNKIIDWKTTSSDKLDEETINKIIYQYGYDISAAMYQYVAHEVLGKWMDYYLVFISKNPPYDCVIVDMVNYGYRYNPANDEVLYGGGVIRFEKLMNLYSECLMNQEWPGADYKIEPKDGVRILEIEPPAYYISKVSNM